MLNLVNLCRFCRTLQREHELRQRTWPAYEKGGVIIAAHARVPQDRLLPTFAKNRFSF
jgi:hypothetical protein